MTLKKQYEPVHFSLCNENNTVVGNLFIFVHENHVLVQSLVNMQKRVKVLKTATLMMNKVNDMKYLAR